jgi:hypothetical protein
MIIIHNILNFVKNNSKIYLLISFCIICFFSLKIYHCTLPLPDGKWIPSNLKNIQVKDPSHFSFAVFGGSRFGMHIFEGVLKQVDHDPDIAFAIHLGDAVLKGGRGHYQHLVKQIENNLGIPLLTVMGENEYKTGRDLYQNIFGPLYYSFQAGKSLLIVIDNVKEDGIDKAQMQWLKKELEDATKYDNRIIFMHRPLNDPKRNNSSQALREESSSKLIDLFLKYQVTHLFASDINGYYEGTLKGIPYTIIGDTGKIPYNKDTKQDIFLFLKVHVGNNAVKVEANNEFLKGIDHMNRLKNRAFIYMDNMVMIHWFELSLLLLALFICVIFIIHKKRAGK